MSVFNALGYDTTITFYKYNSPESRDDDATYTPVLIKDCHVVMNYKKTIDKDGKDNASNASVSFLMVDNPGVDIKESMVEDSFFVLSDTTNGELNEVTTDFADEVKSNYEDVFTLVSVKKETVVLPHYELGGR